MPDSFEVALALANAQRELRNYTDAKENYAAALQLKPTSADAVIVHPFFSPLRFQSKYHVDLASSIFYVFIQYSRVCTRIVFLCLLYEAILFFDSY